MHFLAKSLNKRELITQCAYLSAVKQMPETQNLRYRSKAKAANPLFRVVI
jgi:hypothetical protein